MPTYTDANGNKVATIGWETAPGSLNWWLRYFSAPVSGVVDLITPDFGLFGGPGFCGGHLFNSDNECIDGSGTSIEAALAVDPAKNSSGVTSLSDAAFKAHDQAYYNAWIENQEDSTINKSWLELQADVALLQSLYNVFTAEGYKMDAKEIAYDLLAAKAFAAKIMAFDLAATGVEGFTDTAVRALKDTSRLLFGSITTKSETYTVDHMTHPTNPTTNYTITGDLSPIDFDPNTAGIQTRTDEWGNIITDPDQPDPGRADTLFDTPGNDLIISGGGDDVVHSLKGGQDRIQGGAGCDILDGDNSSSCIIEGGADSDIIFGGINGNSRLFGDTYGDMAALITDGEEAQDNGLKGDIVAVCYGDNYLYGSDGWDILWGGTGRDLIVAGAGNDLIIGDGGDITANYGDNYTWSFSITENNDVYTPVITGLYSYDMNASSGDADVIYAGTGNDYVDAGGGDDEIYGGTGNDTLFGEAGYDFIEGGDGDDILIGDNGDLLADSLSGGDYIDGGAGHDEIDGNAGHDELFGGADNDTIYGGEGDDHIDGEAGADSLYGGAGADVMFGGDNNDYMEGDHYDVAGDDYLDGEAGNDTIIGAGGADIIFGGADDDRLYGDAANIAAADHGDDYIDGEGGHNLIVGFGGNDTLYALDGNDTIYGGDGNDDIDAGDGGNMVLGGAGHDDIWAGKDNDWIQGDTGDDYLDGGAGHNTLIGGDGSDVIYGGMDDDILQGDDSNSVAPGNDYLDGQAGNDTLIGLGGADTLFGGSGHDFLQGGSGSDTLIGGSGSDTYFFNLGDGIDTIDDTASDDGLNVLIFGDGITFNILRLNVGSLDILIGDNGDAIHFDHFDPNDAYGAHAIDIFEFADGTALTYRELIDLGFEIEGTSGDDQLSGTSAPDSIFGLEGNDSIASGAGDDMIDGGAGDDTLYGGTGTDTLIGGAGTDTYLFNFGDGVDTIVDTSTISEGNRIFFGGGITAEDLTFAINGHTLTIHYGENDAVNLLNFDQDEIDGNSLVVRVLGFFDEEGALVSEMNLADFLNQSQNHAPVVAHPIADQTINKCTAFRYIVPGDTFKDIDVGDTLTYSATLADGSVLPSWLTFDAATMTFSGTPTCTGKISVKVTATDTSGAGVSDTFDLDIKRVTYGTHRCDLIVACCDNDLIYAFNGVDTVYSGAGDDIIYGGNYRDFLFGECGNDLIYGEHGNDNLYGGGGHDTLDGGTGADHMIGGCGNDTYIVDKLPSGLFNFIPGDTVTEYDHGGTDTVQSSVSYTLGSNVENLTLTGTSGIHGAGNALHNVLIGNGASNTLTGHYGNDTLVGGSGNDILKGGSGGDTYLFGNADGADTIHETAGIGGDLDVLKLTEATTTDPVIVKQGNDLYVFMDADHYLRIAGEFRQANYGIERLEVSDGHYITRNDIQTIVDTMSAINNAGMDVIQKYNAMMNDEQYQNILAQSWQQ